MVSARYHVLRCSLEISYITDVNSTKHRLVAILFSDIKGYSSLMEERETYALTVLERYETITRHYVSIHNGDVIKSYGDGSLAIFNSTADAVRCARDMQISFREEPKVPLRIGIHVGEVVEKGNDIFGNAVNIASRIESIGIAGGILLSNEAYDKIKNHDEFSTQKVGSFEFHNIEEVIDVYALTNDGLLVPDKKNIEGKLKRKENTASFPWKRVMIPLGILILLFAGYRGFFGDKKIHVVTSDRNDEDRQKSIAILPFDNISTHKDNQYFTDGMHDDLLTFLSKSRKLKVISRNSVAKLKGTNRSIKEIAKMLGVTHILEGSVRRNADQVRINVALIDAELDNSLWAETYDRLLSPKNIFNIQADIANKISSTLIQAVFMEQDETAPVLYTENLKAYENYLRARQLKEEGNKEALYEARDLLEEALALDSDFAEALVLLGNLHIHLVYYAGEDPDVYFPRGWAYMEKGMMLKPNLSEAYALKGSFYHWWKKDFEGAQDAYEKAIELNPNNDNAYYGYAIAYQDLNMNFSEISRLLQKALSINPLNPNLINTSGIYTRENGKIDEALQIFRKGIDIAPEHSNIWGNYSGTYYYKSRIDSVAMISHQCIEQNGRVGSYLRPYLESLSGLSALTELHNELEIIEDSSRQEAIIKYNFLRDFHLQQRNFPEVYRATTQLAQFNSRWPDVDIYHVEDLYYDKKFDEVINLYETLYADIDVASLTKGLLGITMGYIHSLHMAGREEEAQNLLSQIESEKLQFSDQKDMRIFDRLSLDYIKACAATMNGSEQEAINLLEGYLTNGSSFNLRWVELDPIFEVLNQYERYQKLVKNTKDEIANQREQFLDYLERKKKVI